MLRYLAGVPQPQCLPMPLLGRGPAGGKPPPSLSNGSLEVPGPRFGNLFNCSSSLLHLLSSDFSLGWRGRSRLGGSALLPC